MKNLTLPLDVDAPDFGVLPALVVPCAQDSIPNFNQKLYRLYYVLGEQILANVDGRKRKLVSGDLIALAPDELIIFEHKVDLLSVAFHYHFFCIHIRKDEFFCDGIVFNRPKHSPVCNVPDTTRELIENSFNEIRQSLSKPSPLTNSRALSALHTLLLQAAEFMLQEKNSGEMKDISVRKSDLTKRFENILEIHFHIRHDVEFYTDALNVTQATLNRRLKKELGKTTSTLIQERVAIEARRKLSSGQTSIKEVAFMLGFGDQLYFSRFFKKHFGVSPSEYFQ